MRPAGGGGTGSGGGISLVGAAAAGGSVRRDFLGLDFGGESDSAEAACLRSVPLIAAGDSVRCDSTPPPTPPRCPPGFGEKIAEAVMDIGGAGEPRDRLRRRGESSGGAVPLGFGEKIADAVMATGEVASPAAENGRNIFAADPVQEGIWTHVKTRMGGESAKVLEVGGCRCCCRRKLSS